jgi:hypothetical protein
LVKSTAAITRAGTSAKLLIAEDPRLRDKKVAVSPCCYWQVVKVFLELLPAILAVPCAVGLGS